MEDLLKRYSKHQRFRLRATTFVRLNGILETLKRHLPAKAKDITRQVVAEYISTRSDSVKPASVTKEVSVLKHALNLAVDWGLLNSNPAQRAKLPKLPLGRTRYLSPTELKAALEACGRSKNGEDVVTAPGLVARSDRACGLYRNAAWGTSCSLLEGCGS